jgi:hypothetical protein
VHEDRCAQPTPRFRRKPDAFLELKMNLLSEIGGARKILPAIGSRVFSRARVVLKKKIGGYP